MNQMEARARFATARVARLATVRPDGAPHLVPVVFVLEGDTVWLVVDEKPKRHRRLQRLLNIRAEPRVSLLVDSYDEDWSRLWVGPCRRPCADRRGGPDARTGAASAPGQVSPGARAATEGAGPCGGGRTLALLARGLRPGGYNSFLGMHAPIEFEKMHTHTTAVA